MATQTQTPDQLKKFYDYLISSGKVDASYIGDYDFFKTNIGDSTKAQKFYSNLINKKKFTPNEIGSWEVFYKNVRNATSQPTNTPAIPATPEIATGSTVNPVGPTYASEAANVISEPAQANQPLPDYSQPLNLPGPTQFNANASAVATPPEGIATIAAPVPKFNPLEDLRQHLGPDTWKKEAVETPADKVYKSLLTPQDSAFLSNPLDKYGPDEVIPMAGPKKQPWYTSEEGRIPFTEKQLPNIFKIAWDESITGKASDIIQSQAKGVPTGQRLYNLDNPSETEKLIGSVGSLLVDSWTFAVPGASGAVIGAGSGLAMYRLLAKLGLTKWGEEMVAKLVAEGATLEVAEQTVAKGLWMAKEQVAKWGVRFGSSSGGLAGYNTIREVTDQVINSGGSFKDMNYKAVLQENAIGGSLGLLIAPLGIANEAAAKAIDNKVTGNALKILYKELVGGGRLATEAGVFVAGEKGLRGEPMSNITLKDYVDALATFGILHGVSRGTEAAGQLFTRSKNYSLEKAGKGPFAVEFTPEEVQALGKHGIEGTDQQIINRFIDDAVKYGNYPKVEKGDPLASPLFKQVMSDPNVSYNTKAKLAWTLGGVMQQFDFNLGSVDITQGNGKFYVNSHTPEGDLVRQDPFNTPEQAQAFAKDVQEVVTDNQKKNQFRTLDDQVKLGIAKELESTDGISYSQLEDAYNKNPKSRTPEQKGIVDKLFAAVDKYTTAKSAEESELAQAQDYVQQNGYGPDKTHIITVTDKASGKPRFVIDGDVNINPADGTATMGIKPLVVQDETGRKSMIHAKDVSDIAVTPSQDYISQRMADFQQQQQLKDQLEQEGQKVVETIQQQTTPPPYKVGDKITYQGKEGEITDAKNPQEGITAIFADGAEVTQITPDKYPEVQITDNTPIAPTQGGTGKMIVLETQAGKTSLKLQFEQGPEGDLASQKTFADKAAASKLMAGLKNTYANLTFKIVNLADPTDILAKNEFKIVAASKIAKVKEEETPKPAENVPPDQPATVLPAAETTGGTGENPVRENIEPVVGQPGEQPEPATALPTGPEPLPGPVQPVPELKPQDIETDLAPEPVPQAEPTPEKKENSLDGKIVANQKRLNLPTDPLPTLPKQVETNLTKARGRQGAIIKDLKESEDYLYREYKRLEIMKGLDKRRFTIPQIEQAQAKLEQHLKTLADYRGELENPSEFAGKRTAEWEVEPPEAKPVEKNVTPSVEKQAETKVEKPEKQPVSKEEPIIETKPKEEPSHDRTNETGLPGEVGGREKPVQAEPDTGPGKEATGTGGVVQKPQPEEVAPAKQPWEMTQLYVSSAKGEKDFPIDSKVEVKDGKPIYTYSTTVNWDGEEKTFSIEGRSQPNGMTMAVRLHKKVIEQALSEGKTVPPEVLAEYPELTKKEETKPTESTRQHGLSSEERLPKPKVGQTVLDKVNNRTGKIIRVFKPEAGSALENEPYLMDIQYADRKSINMPGTTRYEISETVTPEETTGDKYIGVNLYGEKIYEDKNENRYKLIGTGIMINAPVSLIPGQGVVIHSPSSLYAQGHTDYLTKEEIDKFKAPEKPAKEEESPVDIIQGFKTEDAEAIHKRLKDAFERYGFLDVKLKNGTEIKGIKAIGRWGNGFYYSTTDKHVDEFNKSFSVFDVESFNEAPPVSIGPDTKIFTQPKSTQQEAPPPPKEEPKAEESKGYGEDNTVVSKARYEELRKKLRDKLNNLNSLFDPETLAITIEIAAFHIEAGARKFSEFSRLMIEDLGEKVKPYLKSAYNGARDMPGMEKVKKEMDSYDLVDAFDYAKENKPAEVKPEVKPEAKATKKTLTTEVHEDTNTKTGDKIYLTEPAARLERDVFEAYRKIAKEHNGYYSTFKKGFLFDTAKSAENFRDAIETKYGTKVEPTFAGQHFDEEPLTPQENGTERIHRPTGESPERTSEGRTPGTVSGNGTEGNLGGLPAEKGEHSLPTDIGPDQEGNEPDRSRGTDLGRSDVAAGEGNNTDLNGKLGGKSEKLPKPERGKPTISVKNTRNFVIPPDFVPSETFSKIQKLEDNISALETLVRLIEDGGTPTPQDQQTLFKYVGFGGLKDILRDPNNNWGWNSESDRARMRKVYDLIKRLDPDESKGILKAVQASTANAHYTDIPVIRSIYNIIERIGYTGGRTLESAMGIGHFFGAMPRNLSKNSALSGVELDYLTGKIAQYLYPDANVIISGLQDAPVLQNYFNLIVSNIPFGDIRISDKAWLGKKQPIYNFAKTRVHNYFVVKQIELASPGGLISFITTHNTLDAPGNELIRRYIADNTEFIGAVRLPSTAFKANAGTEVVTDIIFLKKFNVGEAKDQKYDFIKSDKIKAIHKDREYESYDVPINEYFKKHPGNIIGEVQAGGLYSASELTVTYRGNDVAEKVIEIGKKMVPRKIISQSKSTQEAHDMVAKSYVGKDGDFLRSGNLVLQDGKFGHLNIEENQYGEKKLTFIPIKVNLEKHRTESIIKLRNVLTNLMVKEYGREDSKSLLSLRNQLNDIYDAFVAKYGRLRDASNFKIIDLDIDRYNLQGLERYDKKTKEFTGKADIFTQRTISSSKTVTEVDSPEKAILVSLNETGRVDPGKMVQLLGEDWFSKVPDLVYELPEGGYDYRESYLSGNVKAKLAEATKALSIDPRFQKNVDDLTKVIPTDIPATNIISDIGTRWIPAEYYTQFTKMLFDYQDWDKVEVHYVAGTDKYVIRQPIRGYNSNVIDKYGTKQRDGFKILEAALNDHVIQIFDHFRDERGNDVKVFNPVKTQAIADITERIKDEFDSWLWKDVDRRTTLVRLYNDTFNTSIKRKYDGSHLTFPGLSGIFPRQHQRDAVWMDLQNGGGMIDHMVGAGKTLVMILSAMERRRLGIARKPLIIAIKSTVGQIAEAFQSAYPMAKVLAPTTEEFTQSKRRNILAQIATNDWDCVILSHNQYVMLDHERSVQEQVINEELDQLIESVEYFKGGDKNSMSIREIKGLQTRIANLTAKLHDLASRKTDPFSFERLGFDHIYWDESHIAKNLAYTTTYSDIAGLGSKQGNATTFALLLGTTHLHNMQQADRGVTFLTGTPITNSLAELYLILKYLRPRKMQELGFRTFDAWASVFAQHTVETEFGVTNQLKTKDRFRRYINAPELAMLYAEITDVRNKHNLKLPRPNMKGGKMTLVNIKPSDEQKHFVELLIDLAKNGMHSVIGVQRHYDVKKDKAKMVLATTLAGQMTVDLRLIDPNATDDPQSKVNVAIAKVAEIYKQWDHVRGTQLIFSDVGVPGGGDKFNVYDDIRNKLVDLYGIPKKHIKFIHEFNSDLAKLGLFEQMNNGDVRILLGSTKKLGTGVNVQERVVAIHHLDILWTPAGMDQRNGRGVRQGNIVAEQYLDNELPVYTYAIEGTLDAYKYQLLQIKEFFSDQIRSGEISDRIIDEGAGAEGDESASMSFAEFVSILSGNPLVFEKAKWDEKFNALKRSQQSFEQVKYDAEAKLVWERRNLKQFEGDLPKIKLDKDLADKIPLTEDGKFPFEVMVNGKSFAKSKDIESPYLVAGQAALDYIDAQRKKSKFRAPIEVMSAFGFKMMVHIETDYKEKESYRYNIIGVSGEEYRAGYGDLSTEPVSVSQQFVNSVLGIKGVYERGLETIKNTKESITANEEILKRTWDKQDQLDEVIKKRKEIDKALNDIERKEEKHQVDQEIQEEHLTGGEDIIEPSDEDESQPEEPGILSREQNRQNLQDEFSQFAGQVTSGVEPTPAGTSTDADFRNQERLTDPNPTEEQKKSGDYDQGVISFHNMPIHIENARGSIRSGKDENGNTWSNKMGETYGYFDRTEGKDGDEIDVFVGDNLNSPNVYIIDQNNVKTGQFDEHKVMVGFDNLEQAHKAYKSHYPLSMWPKLVRGITTVTPAQLKAWVGDGNRKRLPAAEDKSLEATSTGTTVLDKYVQVADGYYISVNDRGNCTYEHKADASPVVIPGYEFIPCFVRKIKAGELGVAESGYIVSEAITGAKLLSVAFPTVTQAIEETKKRLDDVKVTPVKFDDAITQNLTRLSVPSPRYRDIVVKKPPEAVTLSPVKRKFVDELYQTLADNLPMHSVSTLEIVAQRIGLKKGMDYADIDDLLSLANIAVMEYINDRPGIKNDQARIDALRKLIPFDSEEETGSDIRHALVEEMDNPLEKPAEFMGEKLARVSRDFTKFQKKVTGQIEAIAADLGSPIHIVKNEWFLPPSVRRKMNANKGIRYRTGGLYDTETGEVYIILSNIKSAKHAREVVLHEVVSHKGLRAFFGEKYNRLLDDVWLSMTPKQRRIFEEKYNTEDKREVADEFLGSEAQKDIKLSWVQVILAKIRNWLRKYMFLDYTEKDIANLFRMSQDFMRKQRKAQGREVKQEKFAGEQLQPVPVRETGIRRQIIGEKGAKNLREAGRSVENIDNLIVARKMAKAGKDAKAIYYATGWEKGKDGKWRMEIFDTKIDLKKLVDKNATGDFVEKLPVIYKNDVLYTAYPYLKKIWVHFDKRLAIGNAAYDIQLDSIKIGAGRTYGKNGIGKEYTNVLTNVLLHEIQHGIQMVEGFAKGAGSAEELHKKKYDLGYANDLKNDYEEKMSHKDYREFQEATDRYLDGQITDHQWNVAKEAWENSLDFTAMRSIQNEIKNLGFDLDLLRKGSYTDEHIRALAERNYMQAAGEVEARNVQTRQLMRTEENLVPSLIVETEDIPREAQTITFAQKKKNDLTAYHGTGADFDKFDMSKVGTGEGVQAFGHGMYFTDQREVAKFYAEKVGEQNLRKLPENNLRELANLLIKKIEGTNENLELWQKDWALKNLQIALEKPYALPNNIELLQGQPYNMGEFINDFYNKKIDSAKSIMQVTLPDHFDWMRWDEPIQKNQFDKIMHQAELENIQIGFRKARSVDDVFRQLGGEAMFPVNKDNGTQLRYEWDDMQPAYFDPDLDDQVWISEDDYIDAFNTFVAQQEPSLEYATGEEVYHRLNQEFDGGDEVSAFLERAGVNGIKYPAESIASGRTAENARGFNYVVFDPSPVEITHKLRFSLTDDIIGDPPNSLQTGDEPIQGKPMLQTRRDKFRELVQDMMISVRRMQENILAAGGQVDDLSDVYNDENKSKSRSHKQMERYKQLLRDPMIETIGQIMKQYNLSSNDVQTYLMAKHTPEVNAKFNKMYDTTDQVYAGKLRGFAATDENADHYIDQFESIVPQGDVDRLWAAVHKAARFSLDRYLEDGMISRENYDMITDPNEGYKFYVPLRGFKAETVDDIFDLQSKDIGDGFNPFKTQYGRESGADDPLGYIEAMAYTAIISGNKNLVKQKFLNLVRQNKDRTDLFGVHKVYLVEDVAGNVSETITRPDKVLFDLGMVKVKFNQVKQPRVFGYEASQFDVVVMENGVKYIVTLKDPNVANAINGLLVWKPEITRMIQGTWVSRMTRLMSALYTSWNIAWMPINFIRDVSFAATSHYIQDEYDAKLFMQNIPVAKSAILRSFNWRLSGIAARDANPNQSDLKYLRWQESGGETGYVHLMNMDQFQNRIARDLRALLNEKTKWDHVTTNKAVRIASLAINNMAVLSENISRYATYLTLLEKGFTHEQAVTGSKNITVNFNRKGRLSQIIGALYAFWNANVQGGHTLLKLAKDHPWQFTKTGIGFVVLGYLVSELNRWLSPFNQDEGKTEYERLSPYIRQNFLVITSPLAFLEKHEDKSITIPLPWGFRALYGMGVVANDWVHQKQGMADGMWDISSNIVDAFTPVNFAAGSVREGKVLSAKGLRPLVPTTVMPFYDLAVNEDFAGQKVYREQHSFPGQPEGATPESELGMPYVNKYLKVGTRSLNKLAGGDEFRSAQWAIDPETGKISNQPIKNIFDINPSKIEHVLEAYTGGVGTEINNLVKTITSAVEMAQGVPEAEVYARSIPVVRRLYRQGSTADNWQDYLEYKRQVQAQYYFMNTYKKERERENYVELRQYTEIRSMKHTIDRVEDELGRIRDKVDRLKDSENNWDRISKLYDQQDQIINDAVKTIKELNDKKD